MDIPQIPGLDFDPTSSQLLDHYLKQRILDYLQSGDPNHSTNGLMIPDIELYNWDPKELPRQYNRLSVASSNGRQWFFFCLRKEKYRNSNRSERTVLNVGYWKITSSDKGVKCGDTGEEMGIKKTLTFYRGRIPNGGITNWGMHEYHLNPAWLGYGIEEMPYVVCHVFKRSGKRGDTDDNDELSNHGASGSRAPTQGSSSAQEEGISETQHGHDLPDYTCMAWGREYYLCTDYEGLGDGDGSNNHYATW